MRPVGRAAAIALWSIGAMAVATIAIAGDRTFIRTEPTTPARMACIGLTMLLAIGWPIWSFDGLTRAFVAGQGAIVLTIAAGTVQQGATAIVEWIAACGAAFVVARSTRRVDSGIGIAWASILSLAVGGGTLMLLRSGIGRE